MGRAVRRHLKTATMAASAFAGDSPLFMVDYLLRFLRVAVLLALWRTILAGKGEVSGMTMASVLTYTLVAEVFAEPLSCYTRLEDALWNGTIALRFLPILGEQLESIGQAQASRGVSHEAQSRWRVVRNARQLAALIVPLFVDVYRRSEEMVMAMQARCYQGGKGRTHLNELHFAGADYLALGLAVVVAAGAILAQRIGV